ncbi:MAG: hypothetical protein JSS65_00690 [Armatimonadetes bacterium]|nr:hypothetical protein [Armatimonadota bacterium]
MPKFFISATLPDDFTPTEADVAAGPKIHAFNAELEAAGALFFACGLFPANTAKVVTPLQNGEVNVTDGPFLETKEHIGGFLIIDAADMDEAMAWARRGAAAGGRPLEVRQIFFQED